MSRDTGILFGGVDEINRERPLRSLLRIWSSDPVVLGNTREETMEPRRSLKAEDIDLSNPLFWALPSRIGKAPRGPSRRPSDLVPPGAGAPDPAARPRILVARQA